MKLKALVETKDDRFLEIENILEYLSIKKYTINDDLSIDVDGDVILNLYPDSAKILFDSPGTLKIKFGKVTGDFCAYTYENTTITAKLTSLLGTPDWIGKSLNVLHNNLTSLEHFPKHIGGSIDISDNKITSLKHLPASVDGFLDVSNNKLTSLEGCSKEVNGFFSCNGNNLTSLEGGPRFTAGDYFCEYNQITTLTPAPREVEGNFHVNNNKISSLEGLRTEIGKRFYVSKNEFTWEYIEKLSQDLKDGKTSFSASKIENY